MTTKVLIIISGGNIKMVYSTREIEYMIIDHDNLEIGMDDVPNEFSPSDDVISQRRMGKYIDDIKTQYAALKEDDELDR